MVMVGFGVPIDYVSMHWHCVIHLLCVKFVKSFLSEAESFSFFWISVGNYSVSREF